MAFECFYPAFKIRRNIDDEIRRRSRRQKIMKNSFHPVRFALDRHLFKGGIIGGIDGYKPGGDMIGVRLTFTVPGSGVGLSISFEMIGLNIS